MRPLARRLSTILLAPLLFACAPEPTPTTPPTLQVQSFEQVFRRVGETCPDPDMYGVDWQAAHDELLPRAESARDAATLRPVLEDLLGRLHASHYRVVAGASTTRDPVATPAPGPPGDGGLAVRRVGEQVLVTAVDDPAKAAGIATGWALIRVGDQAVAELLAAADADHPSVLQGDLEALLATREGQVSTLEFLDGEGKAHTVAVTAGPARGTVARVGQGVPVRMVVARRILPGNVGYVSFNAFYPPLLDDFGVAMEAFLAAGVVGLVVDLRNNAGGVVGMVRGLSGWLFAAPTSLGQLRYREQGVDLLVSPRAPAQQFAGPLAVLVDALTASTAEVYAASLQDLGRARIFGTTTAGEALPSVFEPLPNGDAVQMVVAEFRSPAGRRLEGEGVTPDVSAPLSKEALLRGEDPALAAATAWIGGQR